MNIWLIWLGFLLAAIILLVLTDGVKKKFYQQLLGIASLIPLVLALALTVLLPIKYWEVILLITSELFLLFIVLRLLFSRRLRGSRETAKDTGRISIILIVSSALILFLPQAILLWTLLTVILAASLVMFLQLKDGTSKYALTSYDSEDLLDLPTVSVCVPARNETHALADCLSSVLASDYPKLEIIVLDDCSQDKTSRVIHSFAHSGVRFVQGEEPSDNWLGKNQALEVLAKQASGKFLLFMDVDTRLSEGTISRLIDYVQHKKISMVSVLPKRAGYFAFDSLFSTLRYFWQITTPRSIDMPVASALWMIRASELEKSGGLKRAANLIEPERFFARVLAKKHTYRFLMSNSVIGAFYAKKWSSQIETSVRLWYPLLGMQPSRVYLAALGQYLFVFLPYVIVASYAFTQQYSITVLLAFVSIVLQFIVYGIHVFRTQTRVRLLATLIYPFVALQEVALILTSFVQYEFGTVNWKGRNICYPVLSLRSWRE